MAFDAGTIETTLDIDRSPFRKGLVEARKEAEAFEKRGIKLKIDVDKNFANKIQKAINETQSSTGKGIRVPVHVDESQLDDFKKQLDRIGDNTETTAARTGNRMARALFNPLVLGLGVIPGVAAAAGAAGALALGVLPIAMGAIGIAAVKNNEVVKQAFAGTWQEIKTDAADLAEPLADTFVEISHRISASWRTIRPDVAQMFKDSAPLIYQFTDGVLRAAEQAVPRFRQALALSGPAVRGLSNLIEDLGIGVGDMAVEMSKGSVNIGRSADLAGNLIKGLLRDVGTLVAQLAGFWSRIGAQFNQTFDTLMSAVLSFTQGGLRGLGSSLEMTLSIVQALLAVVGPFAQALGQVGGNVLGMLGSWKILAGTMGLVGKVWGALKPSEWASKMSGVVNAVNKGAESFGGFVTKVSGSTAAGERFVATSTKIVNGISKAASTLPLLGTAFLAGKAVVDSYWPSADQLAESFQRGGKEAEEASGKIYDIGNNMNRGSFWGATFAASLDEVHAAVKRQRAGMTELERAQSDAAKAQRDYDYAVDKFGKDSPQAEHAAIQLAGATNDVEDAQRGAADATKDHTDRMIEQTNLMLGAIGARLNYQSALLQLEQAQRDLSDAVRDHGAGSLEARQADVQYQNQLLSTVNALGARVKAEQAAKGETEATRLSVLAMHQEIARLAVEAGENLPPALAEMAAGLTDAELKAMGVTREVDATGNAIYRLPPGKTLSFPTNAPVAEGEVNRLGAAIERLPKWTNIYLNYVVRGTTPTGDTPGLLGSAAPPRAKGGPVRKGSAYWVGDDPQHLPELFFPDQDGFVLNGRDSARISDSVSNPNTRQGLPVGGDEGSAAPDFGTMVAATAQAIYEALNGARLEVGGDGMARLVNLVNNRNGGR
jgi:hypothetical protein